MKVIYKYSLKIIGNNIINIPLTAEILSVQVQGETPCIWALVDTEKEPVDVLIETFGTGHKISNEFAYRQFIGTYQIKGGKEVYHVFRRL